MNINVYKEYAKSILENMLDNTLIDIKSSLYLEKISPKTQKNSDPISDSKKWPNGPKTISRYCPFKGQVHYKYNTNMTCPKGLSDLYG